jgi:hypothetical protein
MTKGKNIAAREAKHGEKMIEVKIRFWTDGISKGPGNLIVPKHAWTSGVVRMQRNKAHGIVPTNPIPFNSLLDLGKAIEQVLKEHGIVLHIGRGMKKYISPDVLNS